jgi:hypothetical protein
MAITSLPEWVACRAISSWWKQYSGAEKIFKAASAAELDDLILVAESGSVDDQHVALSTLNHFAYAKLDARWTAARRDSLVHVLRKHVVERYPDDIARHSVSVLRLMDFSWLDEFLTGIPLEQISEEDRPKLVYDLDNVRTERSRERLLLMMEAGWRSWGGAKVEWPMKAAPGSLPPQPTPDEWDYNPHTRIAGALLSSPEWKHLLKSQNPLREIQLWLDCVTDSDLADLADAWERGDPDDHRCAGGVIRQLALRNDSRLADYRARILRRAHSLATKIFQETGILPSEYYVIRDLSREQAIDFVTACVDSEESSLKHLQSAFREMMTLGGPRIIARIEKLGAQGGPLAKDAATYLDEAGPVTPEKIATKSARWRKTRNARDLRWLFFSHIERNTHKGSTIEEILTLLGKPSEASNGGYCWRSKDPMVHLYLETDESGRLDWMKLYVD